MFSLFAANMEVDDTPQIINYLFFFFLKKWLNLSQFEGTEWSYYNNKINNFNKYKSWF